MAKEKSKEVKDKPMGSSSTDKIKFIAIQMSAALHKKIKIVAAKEEVTMTKIICDALEEKFKNLKKEFTLEVNMRDV